MAHQCRVRGGLSGYNRAGLGRVWGGAGELQVQPRFSASVFEPASSPPSNRAIRATMPVSCTATVSRLSSGFWRADI